MNPRVLALRGSKIFVPAVLSGCATKTHGGTSLPVWGCGTGWVALVTVLALFLQVPIEQGPSVAQLKDGRQGFVIREKAGMDAESREEFERAVAMMNAGKNDKAIELLTKVIERSPGVTAPYINIAMAYMRTGKPESGGAAPQNRFGTGS